MQPIAIWSLILRKQNCLPIDIGSFAWYAILCASRQKQMRAIAQAIEVNDVEDAPFVEPTKTCTRS